MHSAAPHQEPDVTRDCDRSQSYDGSMTDISCYRLILEEEVLSVRLLLLVFNTVVLVNAWTQISRVTTHADIEHRKERVHTGQQRLGRPSVCLDRWLAFVHNHPVSKIRGHNNVVLNNHGCLLRVQNETLNDPGCLDTLF